MDYSLRVHLDFKISDATDSDVTNVTGQKRLTFNVGGVIFETMESTIVNAKRPVMKLLDPDFMKRHWDNEKKEYFFDRDPTGFQAVINYIRTGVLHLPNNMCSPQVTAELMYWGLPRIDIEPCCWKDYSIGIQSLENLRKLESDRQPAYTYPESTWLPHREVTRWSNLRIKIWNIVSDPASSKLAKVYLLVSMLSVLLSIITFCVSTLPQYNDLFQDAKTFEANKEAIHFHLKVISYIDTVLVLVFSLDLSLHLFSWPKSVHYISTFNGIVDVGTLVPDVLEVCISLLASLGDKNIGAFSQFISTMRIFRAFRVFRLFKRVKPLWIIVYTLRDSMGDFAVMLNLLCMIVIIFSAIIFNTENGDNGFDSIPRSFWWSIMTMTTVGYGDMVPKTVLGKLWGSVAAFVGLLVLGLSIPVLSFNFASFSNNVSFMTYKEKLYLSVIRRESKMRSSVQEHKRAFHEEEKEEEKEEVEEEEEGY